MKIRYLSIALAVSFVLGLGGCTNTGNPNVEDLNIIEDNSVTTTSIETEPTMNEEVRMSLFEQIIDGAIEQIQEEYGTDSTIMETVTTTSENTSIITDAITETTPSVFEQAKQRRDEVLSIFQEKIDGYTSVGTSRFKYDNGVMVISFGEYHLYLEREQSFSGDTYYLSVSDKYGDLIISKNCDNEWFSNVDVKSLYEDEYEEKHYINYVGGTVIKGIYDYGDEFYYYDFIEDEFIFSDNRSDTGVGYAGDKFVIIPHYSSIYMGSENYIGKCNYGTGEEIRLIDDVELVKKFDDAMLVDTSTPWSDGRYLLYDYDGNLLIDLKDYSVVNPNASSFNGREFMFISSGKDSGYYMVTLDLDGKLKNEPKYLEGDGSDYKLFISDNFYVITKDLGDYPTTYKAEFYEIDGTFITSNGYKNLEF